MGKLLAGFARMDITPELGVPLAGYYVERISDGVRDPLEVSASAVSDGEKTAVVVGADLLQLDFSYCLEIRKLVAERKGVDADCVFIACSHTHTGPVVSKNEGERFKSDRLYDEFLMRRIADTACLAIDDMRPAKVYSGTAVAQRIAFVRRFRMKSGKVQTNPGVWNPEIEAPIGDVDETVRIVRFTREDADDIAIVNFGVHPDVIGGCEVSADYPGFMRRTLEKALDGVKCVFLNGAEGDVNHVNVNPVGGDVNGLEMKSFDAVARGYEHSRHMGRRIAGAVIGAWDKLTEQEETGVGFGGKTIEIASNREGQVTLERAEEIIRLHESGRDAELEFKKMELTTAVAEAYRIRRLAKGPDHFDLHLSAVRVGNVALLGIPGEPFTDIGRRVIAGSPFGSTAVCSLANGCEGYFPTYDAYAEGGYEARSSIFASDVADRIVDGAIGLLEELKG